MIISDDRYNDLLEKEKLLDKIISLIPNKPKNFIGYQPEKPNRPPKIEGPKLQYSPPKKP